MIGGDANGSVSVKMVENARGDTMGGVRTGHEGTFLSGDPDTPDEGDDERRGGD